MSRVLTVASVICFVFAVFGFNPTEFQMLPLGLAFLAAAQL